MKSNVVPLGMTDHALMRRIASLARDSANVVITGHARTWMRQRRILPTQILKVLQGGNVVEHAHRNVHGNWQCTLERIVSGDRIKVVAAIHTSAAEVVVVITVMN